MARSLLASAGQLELIHQAVHDFYAGTKTTLVPNGDDAWRVVRTSDGKEMTRVQVRRMKGRYRLELVEEAGRG